MDPRHQARTTAQLISHRFHAWENRGRGWKVWDEPVELEPPFVPFELQPASSEDTGLDDGRRPAPLGALILNLRARFTGRLGRTRPDEDEDHSDEVPETASAEPVAEYRLSVPPSLVVSRDGVENFLLSLPATIGALAFEIVGAADEITVLMTCSMSDAGDFRERLRAHFPDVVLVGQDEPLAKSWERADGPSLYIDFGLASEFMLPLRIPRRFDIDPLTSVFAALSHLLPAECTVVQVLFRPTQRPWIPSIEQAVTNYDGTSLFADAPDLPRVAREKVSSPLFATVLRVAIRSPDPERLWEIARSVGGALSTFADTTNNELMPLSNHGYDDIAHEADVLCRTTHRSGMLLNVSELASIVHPPSASVRIAKLRREVRKTKQAPAIATGHDLVLGDNVHAGVPTKISLSPEQRSRHMYVVGASGTGKSTFLLNLITQDLNRGEGVAVLDPHGDLIDDVLDRMPQSRMDDVVVLDPSDTDYPLGLNIFSAHSELEKTLLSSDLVAVFRRLSTSWGDQMNSVLANAILAVLESEQGGTLLDLRRFLVEPAFRREFLKTVGDRETVYYWEKEFPLLTHKPLSSILTRLNTFLRPKLIRHMVAQRESRFDFGSIMNNSKVFLARLAHGGIGEENAYLLGTLIVSKIQQIAMSRQELAQAKRRPFYLYIDEFHNFITPSMAQILAGARKYRLGLVLAHQDLRQLSSRNQEVLDAVLTNPYTRVCFRVGDQDARSLEDGFSSFDRKDLQNLGTGQAIVRIERSEYDFNLDTSDAPPVDDAHAAERREQVIAASRDKYARRRVEVEALFRHPTTIAAPETIVAKPQEPPESRPTKRRTPQPQVPTPVRDATALQTAPDPAPTPLPGRGGEQHKYLQELFKRWAEAHGWRATVEEGIVDGKGSVDVALRKGDRSVACEISVSTSAEHEMGNVQKCLAAGFEHVIVAATKKSTLKDTSDLVREALTKEDAARVTIAEPDAVFSLLERLDAEAAGAEATVRGYKVRVRYKPLDEDEKSARRGAVSQVIAKALRRLKTPE